MSKLALWCVGADGGGIRVRGQADAGRADDGIFHVEGGYGFPEGRAACPAGYSCVVYVLPCGSIAEAKAARDKARADNPGVADKVNDPAVAKPNELKDCMIAGIPVWRYDFAGFPVIRHVWNPDGQGYRDPTEEEQRAFREATKRPEQ